MSPFVFQSYNIETRNQTCKQDILLSAFPNKTWAFKEHRKLAVKLSGSNHSLANLIWCLLKLFASTIRFPFRYVYTELYTRKLCDSLKMSCGLSSIDKNLCIFFHLTRR
jgi:hypothetical protein